MAQPVQTRVPALVQGEAEQVTVDIVASNEEELGVGVIPSEKWEES
jgi:hypothetical protein